LKKLLLILVLAGLFHLPARSQTIPGSADANAKFTDGVANALAFPGSDIGEQINNAFAACQDAVGVRHGCTVRVPNGVYSYATTIVIPTGAYAETLWMDDAAALTYTGSGNAVYVSQAGVKVKIAGGNFYGTAAATGGIVLAGAMQDVNIDHVGIRKFSTADGILDLGVNVANIEHCDIRGNLNGIHLIGRGGYASNAVHIEHNEIVGNLHWGILDGDITRFKTGVTSAEFGNSITDNDLEGNGTASAVGCWAFEDFAHCYGSILEALTVGTTIKGNYFEGNTIQIQLGVLAGTFPIPAHLQKLYDATGTAIQGGTPAGTVIEGNYITSGARDFVTMQYAANATVRDNAMSLGAGSSTAGKWNRNGTICEVDLSNAGNLSGFSPGSGVWAGLCWGGQPNWPKASLTTQSQQVISPAGPLSLSAATASGTLLSVHNAKTGTDALSIDAAGDGAFEGQVKGKSVAAGSATWTSGEGVPTGECVATGSLYSNERGKAGSTLWVCIGKAWVDVK